MPRWRNLVQRAGLLEPFSFFKKERKTLAKKKEKYFAKQGCGKSVAERPFGFKSQPRRTFLFLSQKKEKRSRKRKKTYSHQGKQKKNGKQEAGRVASGGGRRLHEKTKNKIPGLVRVHLISRTAGADEPHTADQPEIPAEHKRQPRHLNQHKAFFTQAGYNIRLRARRSDW